MSSQSLVLTLLLLPLVGAILVALLGAQRRSLIRWISLGVSGLCVVLAATLAIQFHQLQQTERYQNDHQSALKDGLTFLPEMVPGSTPEDPHRTTWSLFSLDANSSGTTKGGIQFFLGVDGINVWMIVLTAVLMIPTVLISGEQVKERSNEFYAWLLFLKTTMFGIFLSFDVMLFYVFFELSLVPLFFLIGIWGGSKRHYAAKKFLIYTLTGSLITLLGIIGIIVNCFFETRGEVTFSVPRLVEIVHQGIANPNSPVNWESVQFWVFLALIAGLAIKVPFVPVHTWLPLAHVEAPTAGSVDLAGVLLKVGAFGFLRLVIPLTPDACLKVGTPVLGTLAVIGVIYGALCAFAQTDVKRLIAYSSVSHLGMCMLGIFALNQVGMTGGLMVMINHGLSAAGLFLVVSMIYERYHTREMAEYGGMSKRLPLIGAFMVFICLTSVGLPGLNGFIGEILVIMGVMDRELQLNYFPWFAVLGSLGIVLGPWYLFTMLRRVFFGEVKEPKVHHGGSLITDMKPREMAIMVPLAILCVVIGLYPQPIIKTAKPDVDILATITQKARERKAKKAQGEESALPPRKAQRN